MRSLSGARLTTCMYVTDFIHATTRTPATDRGAGYLAHTSYHCSGAVIACHMHAASSEPALEI
jgi:hypothetical protein